PPPPAPRPSRAVRRARRAGGGTERIGNKLALAFWQRVADGERLQRQKIARSSPLAALYRLYGPAGPLWALGIAPGACPSEVRAGTLPHTDGHPELTDGDVTVGGATYPYVLRWWLEAGKPVVGELMPAPHPAVLPPDGSEAGWRLHEGAPPPLAELDPVAATVWRVELGTAGLPLAARCLATWWRLGEVGPPGHPPEAIGATVAVAVAQAAGIRRPRADTAAAYGSEPLAIDCVRRELGDRLRIDRARGW
ncbi:MAG: hypothetical protein ACRDL4_19185, partial [Thermoleophilaceae bacterium]